MTVAFGNISGSMLKSGTMPKLPKWESWTVSEASRMTGYNQEYIRRLIRNKEIEAEKVGNMWLIKIESLVDYIKQIGTIDDRRYGPKQK